MHEFYWTHTQSVGQWGWHPATQDTNASHGSLTFRQKMKSFTSFRRCDQLHKVHEDKNKQKQTNNNKSSFLWLLVNNLLAHSLNTFALNAIFFMSWLWVTVLLNDEPVTITSQLSHLNILLSHDNSKGKQIVCRLRAFKSPDSKIRLSEDRDSFKIKAY